MFRTGMAALLLGVVGISMAGAAEPGDRDRQSSGEQQTLMDWLRSGLNSSPRQAPLQPTTARPAPVPIEMRPVVPNTSPVSGPQYFSAASGQSIPRPVHPGRNWQQYQPPQPVHRTSPGYYRPMNTVWTQPPAGRPASPSAAGSAAAATSPSGVPLAPGTALYPAPQPGIPHQVGGTALSNQFLNPHEMLYAHEYRAMYPPYSYKVNGHWLVTPFGVWSHEDWYLQGTTVNVKYKSHISPFALFKPPVIR